MLQIISSLSLVLISLEAEYLIDVSIKCRIQYWLWPCSFKSKYTMSLNLFQRVNPTLGQWGGLLNFKQTEQESQTSQIISRGSLLLKALLPLTEDIYFSFDPWANCQWNFSTFFFCHSQTFFKALQCSTMFTRLSTSKSILVHRRL